MVADSSNHVSVSGFDECIKIKSLFLLILITYQSLSTSQHGIYRSWKRCMGGQISSRWTHKPRTSFLGWTRSQSIYSTQSKVRNTQQNINPRISYSILIPHAKLKFLTIAGHLIYLRCGKIQLELVPIAAQLIFFHFWNWSSSDTP